MSVPTAPQSNELAVLFPDPVVLTIGGKEVAVKQLTIRQIGRVAKAIAPLAGMKDANIGSVLAEHTEDVIIAVAAATGEPVEWIGELPPAEFLRLTTTVIEVNRESFLSSVLPAFAGLMKSVATPPRGTGPTSSAS